MELFWTILTWIRLQLEKLFEWLGFEDDYYV